MFIFGMPVVCLVKKCGILVLFRCVSACFSRMILLLIPRCIRVIDPPTPGGNLSLKHGCFKGLRVFRRSFLEPQRSVYLGNVSFVFIFGPRVASFYLVFFFFF
jgi:hypothetical protein